MAYKKGKTVSVVDISVIKYHYLYFYKLTVADLGEGPPVILSKKKKKKIAEGRKASRATK